MAPPWLHHAERAMKYLCLVYHDPSHPEAPPQPLAAAYLADAHAYADELRQRDCLLAAHTLEDTRAGTIVRVREGTLLLNDLPCSPIQPRLASYYLIEARDLNQAIRLAARHPAAHLGSIEIRPVSEAPAYAE
jgi:hypothetical protein